MQIKGKVARLGVAALALAAVAGGTVAVSSRASAQAPVSVPVARFYGNAAVNGGQGPVNMSIVAQVGSTTCNSTQPNNEGSGVFNNAQYFVDIQAIPGCVTPGSVVKFTAAGGLTAKETGTIPDIPGTAVHLNLTLGQAATPAATVPAPPRPPTMPASTATQAAPPPRPSPSATPAPSPVVRATPSPVAVQRGVVQQAPKGPVSAQGPKYGAGGGYAGGGYAAPATSPRLPSTGTGGLLDQQTSNSQTGWALAVVVLAALGVSATGLVAYRRSR